MERALREHESKREGRAIGEKVAWNGVKNRAYILISLTLLFFPQYSAHHTHTPENIRYQFFLFCQKIKAAINAIYSLFSVVCYPVCGSGGSDKETENERERAGERASVSQSKIQTKNCTV